MDRTEAHAPTNTVTDLVSYLHKYRDRFTNDALRHMPIKMTHDVTEELLDVEVGIVTENGTPVLLIKRKGELS